MPRVGLIVLLIFVVLAAILALEIVAYQNGYFGPVISFTPGNRAHTLPPVDFSTFKMPAPPPPLRPLPDGDVLAARVPAVNAIYQKVRDDAFAAYAHDHPQPQSYDEEAHSLLKLLAYLSVRGDFYGECLWQQADAHLQHVNKQCQDPIWCEMDDVYGLFDAHSSNDNSARASTKDVLDFVASGYPPLLKQIALRSGIKDLVIGKNLQHNPLTTSLDALPKLADAAVQNYAQLITDQLPHQLLFEKAADLLEAAQNDEPSLQSIAGGIDKAFATSDPTNPIAPIIQGQFLVDDAWNARGSGWANTVTPDGWRLFGERLDKAETLLTDAYSKNPNEQALCRVMMTVVLGRQEPHDQMEAWFQRGIKLDPGYYSIYMAKRWYLLPRWYGSAEDVWKFGLECADTNNYDAKIPLVLIEAIDDAGRDDPVVYERPDIWGPVEKTFRAYLDKYPDALSYRTRFFKCAVDGEHWDVANEQLKLMNGDWDHSLYNFAEMAPLVQATESHANPGK
jgi:tetratricopeptide (TPR) repeat protein